MALKLPGVVELAHMGHPDFRVGGKIFATLSPDDTWGMVKLTPEQQGVFVREQPRVFEAFDNAWGRWGCTKVHLKAATKGVVGPAMAAAWENVAAGGGRHERHERRGRGIARPRATIKVGRNHEIHELHEKGEAGSHATTAARRCPTRMKHG